MRITPMKTCRFGITALAVAVFSLGSFADAEWRHGERQPLWPEGRIPDFQEHQIGAMTDETHVGAGPKRVANPDF